MLDLAGLALGGGAAAVSLLLAAMMNLAHPGGLLIVVALAPAILVHAVHRHRFQPVERRPLMPERLVPTHPVALLAAAAVLIQSAAHWATGEWLPLFLMRQHGLGVAPSVLILSMFWLALVTARVTASRLSHGKDSGIWPPAPTLAAVAGGLFLLFTADTSGALAGALLLGAGSGVTQRIAVQLLGERLPRLNAGAMSSLATPALGLVLLISGGIGKLASRTSMELLIWWVIASSLAVFLLLAVIVVEARLTARSTAPG
jgi:hypothetical protein